MRATVPWITCAMLAAAAGAQAVPSAVVAEIARRFDDPRFAHAHWGVIVRSLATGEIWYERNADRLFMPASNQKILTGAAALVALGPEWRFTTRFVVTGEIDSGTLRGDLVASSDGDPTLYTRFHDDPRDVFRALAKRLRALGVERISGDVIGDDDAFEEPGPSYGMTLENLPFYYAAPVGALQLGENYVDLVVRPPANPAEPAAIEVRLPNGYLEIENAVEVVADGPARVGVERAPGSLRARVTGRIAAGGRPRELAVTVPNPTLFYATVLRETLVAEGIEVDGRARDGDDVDGLRDAIESARELSVHRSPPLADVLKVFLEVSQNLYGETLVRALGRVRRDDGSFAAGREVVHETLEGLGVAPERYVFADGSGLCRYDFVSPRALADVLEAMSKHEHADVWRRALPLAGREGTLRRRMRDTPAEANVIAKTGTISNVRGLSGYVTTGDGEPLVFSFLVNAHRRTTRETEEVTDGVLALLAGLER